jgi:hypothetical protein
VRPISTLTAEASQPPGGPGVAGRPGVGIPRLEADRPNKVWTWASSGGWRNPFDGVDGHGDGRGLIDYVPA